MRIFLTGGTGLVGQPLTRALLRRGWEVTALVRNVESKEARAIQALGVRLVKGDVTDRETMRAPMAGADVVFHNAGWVEFSPNAAAKVRMQAINVQGTENTLGLAAELGIPKVIYTSSMVVFGPTGGDAIADETFQRRYPPSSYYEQTKTDAHAIAVRLQQNGTPIITVCPVNVIGPNDHSPWGYFARLYVRGWLPPLLWGRDCVFSLVHVEDLAETMVLAAEKGRPGETYIVSGGTATMRDIASTWLETPGGCKPKFWLNRTLATMMGMMADPFLRMVGLPAFISREVVDFTYGQWQYSAGKAKRELGAEFRSLRKMWYDTLADERAAASMRRWTISPE